ncbi:MAG: Xanthine dehydrogenase iron-sulfur subunit [Candidatus Ozemobacter sibiricus]|uniref:Xanthine dehydrogenase iron-sulfur subunit n=1 Tax=Candidatus Ozemobacter sibiricus TaxID=2268124 RepID=A0A367ZUI7_9BACT|nr:MAG: Xanthine dehydrogenase iron-sulfur subunit [Candidatus Ozemobacter sibiricus]
MPTQELIPIRFALNGRTVEARVPPGMTLLELVRREFRLTAAKEGCGKGECGACTVLLNDQPINSCLKLAASLRPTDRVVTLEGLADDPLMVTIQKAYVAEGAVQCGFCIPGMVMSSYHLLRTHPQPSAAQIKEFHSGNLCRCTGYAKIEKAVAKAAAAAATSGQPAGGPAPEPRKETR